MGNIILIIINNLSTGTEGTQWQEAIQKADNYLGSMKTPPSGHVSGKESVSWPGAASEGQHFSSKELSAKTY